MLFLTLACFPTKVTSAHLLACLPLDDGISFEKRQLVAVLQNKLKFA